MLPPQLRLRAGLLFPPEESVALHFCELLACNFAGDFCEAGQISAFASRSANRSADPDSGAVFPDVPPLVFGCIAAEGTGELVARSVRRLVFGGEEHLKRLTYDLLRRISEYFLGAIAPLQDYSGRIQCDNGIGLKSLLNSVVGRLRPLGNSRIGIVVHDWRFLYSLWPFFAMLSCRPIPDNVLDPADRT